MLPLRPLRALLFVAGLSYLLVGIAMFAAPRWFFETIGPHGPFNRHYVGDIAAFVLPLGVGLMLAAGHPGQWQNVIGLGALASVLHALNHTYDAITHHAPLEHWLVDTLPLLCLGLLLTFIYLQPKESA